MDPFKIATVILDRADQDESIEDFVMRTMPSEKVSDFSVALDMLDGWETAFEEMRRLCSVLKGLKMSGQLKSLIAAKRALGYDPEFEAILARRWRCWHCGKFASIERVIVPLNDPTTRLFICTHCGHEGMAPVVPDARFRVHEGGKAGAAP